MIFWFLHFSPNEWVPTHRPRPSSESQRAIAPSNHSLQGMKIQIPYLRNSILDGSCFFFQTKNGHETKNPPLFKKRSGDLLDVNPGYFQLGSTWQRGNMAKGRGGSPHLGGLEGFCHHWRAGSESFPC